MIVKIGLFPQIGMNIKKKRNHQPGMVYIYLHEILMKNLAPFHVGKSYTVSK